MLCIGEGDVDLHDARFFIFPSNDPSSVRLTLTRDSIAQEVNETFTLTIEPDFTLEGYTATRLLLPGTILDADSKLTVEV